MQRACWQYEDEPVKVGLDDDSLFGLQQPAEYKRVKNPWEFASLDTEELQAEEDKRQKAKDYKFLKPWDLPQSSNSIVDEFEKNLERMNYKGTCPYDNGSVSLDVLNEQKTVAAKDYKYKPMWEKLELTPKQAEQIKNYQLVTPYERQGLPSKIEDKDLKVKAVTDNNKSIAPWAVGSLPADQPPIKINPKKPTTLWNDETKTKAAITIESSGDPVLDSLRLQLKQRGAAGIMGLAKKFKIMDDNDNGTLDINEFKKAMKECKISDISDKALAHLFRYFDKDDSGSINYDEFLVGIRGVLSARRRELVNLAFTILDKDGSGVVDIKDIQGVYNGRSHPDVIGGRRTEEEVLIEFIDNFNIVKKNAVMTGAVAAKGKKTAASEKDVAVKGAITRDMFIDYYSNLSASIDSDDYFELMIRNSWHISGGEGWSANTTNKRVLVKHADGRETVEEIKNDLGLKANDKVGMVQRLRAQGIAAAAVSTTGGSENGRGGDGSSSVDVAYYNSLHNQNVNTNGKAGTANASKPVGRVLWDVVGKANENVNPVTNPVPAATTLAKTVYIPANLKHLIDNPENNLAKTYPLRANQKKAPQPLGAYQS